MSGGANFQMQTMSFVPNFVETPQSPSSVPASPPSLDSLPRPSIHLHLHATIFILLQVHLSLVLVNLYLGRSTLDQSLLIQLGSELHHLSTNQTLRFHVCRSLIHIASRCCHPHVPINTLDNFGYGCMIASFLRLFLYYYGHSDFLWPTILAVIFISPT